MSKPCSLGPLLTANESGLGASHSPLSDTVARAYLAVRSVVAGSSPAVAARLSVDPIETTPQAHLELVLRWLWASTGAKTFGDAIERWAAIEFGPEPIQEGSRSVMEAPLEAMIGVPIPGEEHWRVFLSFPEGEELILRERIATGTRKPLTLGAIGESLGLSRERVRQIESTMRKRLARMDSESSAAIHHLASRLRHSAGRVTTEAIVMKLAAQLARGSSSQSTLETDLRRDVLVLLAGGYLQRSELWFSAEGEQDMRAAEARLESLDEGDPADEIVNDVIDALQPTEELKPDIMDLLGIRTIEGHQFIWGRTQLDKALVVLAARGEPMEMVDIHEGVGLEVSPRSLMQRLQGDSRFMRRGKDTYGLRKWGGEEYSGIAEELEQAIERAGGSAPLEELIESFVAQFDVSAKSVRSYAASRQFIRRSDGNLAMRGPDDPEVITRHAPIEVTQGAFLLDGEWHLRIEVDDDVLRGSGTAIRQSIAVAAGLEPDLSVGFMYDGSNEVLFSWRRAPAIGSVRGIALDRGCVNGDLLFLPLAGEEPRSSRVIHARDRFSESGVRRLGAEIGIHPDDLNEADDHPPLDIRLSMGLTLGSDWHDLVDRIRDRKEDALLKHIPSEWL